MYTLLVVIVEIRGERLSLAEERDALSPVVANAFRLDGPVKALDVSVVIRSV